MTVLAEKGIGPLPFHSKALEREGLAAEASKLLSRGVRVLLLARGAWNLWRMIAREAWMRGDNYFLLEAMDVGEASLAGVSVGVFALARRLYYEKIPADRAVFERMGLREKRVSRRALLSSVIAGSVLTAVEKPEKGDACRGRGVEALCDTCLDKCGGAACSAALCSIELLNVPGYSREGLLEFLRTLRPRPPGLILFASRWSMDELLSALVKGSMSARAYIVPVTCPYVVGLEELLAARALGLEPVLVDHGGEVYDPYCESSRSRYRTIVARDYERITGEPLSILEPSGIEEVLAVNDWKREAVPNAGSLLAKGLHALAFAEVERRELKGGVSLESLLSASLRVDPGKCTLCSACSQECPVMALGLVRKGFREALVFTPGRCIACGYCAEICPEKAIVVEYRLEPGPLKPRTLVEQDTVRCIACGKPVAPRNLVVSVARKMMERKLPEETLSTILLCNECRAKYQLGLVKVDAKAARKTLEQLLRRT